MSAPPSQTSALPDPSHFVDALCANLLLTQAQNSDLQGAVQIGQSVDRPSLLLHLVTQANILHLQNMVDKLIAQDVSTASVLEDFKSKVSENWAPTEDDKTTTLKVIKEVLTDPHSASFTKAAEEIFAKLDQHKNSNKLSHMFKTQKCHQIFLRYIRDTTNNTKGQLQRKIKSSLGVSFSEAHEPKFISRVVLWRRYAREADKSADNMHPPKRTSSGTEIEPEPLQKKSSESFWRGFDNWLEDCCTENGSDFDSEPWQRYYEETMRLNEQESAASITAPVPQPLASMFHGLSIPPTQGSQLDSPSSPFTFSSSSPSQRENSHPISRLPSRAHHDPPVPQLDLLSSSSILFSSPTPLQRGHSRPVSTVPLPVLHQPAAHHRTPSLGTSSSLVLPYNDRFYSSALSPLPSRTSTTLYSYPATPQHFTQEDTAGFVTSSWYTPDNDTDGASGSSPFIQWSCENARSFDESAASRSRAEHRISRPW
ncbi:hypothetical protein D9758_011491 [Tetrapyrgos nigripes]|uniref:Uncharacterized protein n=1 Tax=Tetrapyrgos nigripes TaxID=182062 RepID=A0A8H5FQW3_9AGAR|nr:hypothetical protein D9758_011491 [Tetrapyrgos nigripes]